jgi:hypothetical protein
MWQAYRHSIYQCSSYFSLSSSFSASYEKVTSDWLCSQKSDAAELPKSVPPKIVEPEAPSSPSQREPAQAKAVVTRPLSPYTV